ncbi:AMP-binding protein [Noviherbaspirillum sedimenti]|uniref:Long-chain fatty acid--CoA ligase n=1 Tax=Noviherbaspirillum sedimenti TaxID=2320865 RepID=A0A3A3GIH8_9BURK|nr:AMP-binding protein [Noviherbaspirillum sedimenti]RJG02086.1 long-chain fatty acid--CoA ligase [Noviherbaspirillum sedimenti]
MKHLLPDSGGLPRIPASVVHMLAEAARERPEAAAISFEGTRLNYRQYAAAVAALAASWRQRVGPGQRVALVMQNSLDLAIATYAVHALRAQVVALNPGYSARELSFMLDDAAPGMVVHDQTAKADIAACCPGLPAERFIATSGGASFAALAEQAHALPEDLPGHDDLATLQYTGGTTGRPKGVNISHRHLAFNLAQREALLPTQYGAETVLCVMPLFHVSAVAMSLHLACYAASELIVHRRFDASAVLQTIGSRRVTSFSGAPAIYHSLAAHPELPGADLRSLRACYSGAAPLPQEVLRRWEELTGCPILEGYGMSEAGPCMTYNPARGVRKPGSVGLPVPASKLQIVAIDDASRVLAPGEAGEIRVRGPHVSAGYRNRPDETAAVLRDGWMHTGDIACMDEDGYVFIKGRKHDTINVGGFNVYPREIEEVLLSHPSVREAAAFGVPHPRYGQVVHAWVVADPGAAPLVEALLNHCAAQLVRYKIPHAIGFAPGLPKTGVGKLARGELRAVPATAETTTKQHVQPEAQKEMQ